MSRYRHPTGAGGYLKNGAYAPTMKQRSPMRAVWNCSRRRERPRGELPWRRGDREPSR